MRQPKVNTLSRLAVALTLAAACATTPRAPPETHAQPIAARVLEAKRSIESLPICREEGSCRFLAFWDFDGTLLRGDCSEGLNEEGRAVYPGLAEVAIRRGLSKRYGPGELPRFWREYRALEEQDPVAAYRLLPLAFAGARLEDVHALAREHFHQALRAHYFRSSLDIFRALEAAGIENHVISASPHFFVTASSDTLGLPAERIHGIRLGVAGGRLTEEVLEPVTYAAGKSQVVQEIAERIHSSGPQVFLIAGFGNSYHTDGDFLSLIASRKLPAGSPVVVMINGDQKKAGQLEGAFLEVRQRETVEGR
ncbi:MAG: haloacid dehalogenase-like hydrolase [Myxococcales bacterium]|nr:haloacid dehalogenase-like hydrolase [Myxococcales bacterium]